MAKKWEFYGTICPCGCGEPCTTVQGGLYRPGHSRRGRIVKPKGYPMRTPSGVSTSELLHRQRAEAALGRPLPATAEVHHLDGDTHNPNARLIICQDRAYHALLHVRARIRAAGGDPAIHQVCSCCQQPKPFADFSPTKRLRNGQGIVAYCRPCANAKAVARRALKRQVA